MNDTKPWYLSRTVWAGILQIGLGLAVALGMMDESQAAGVLASFPDTLVGLISMVLGALTINGRIAAEKTIGS